jgi:hypothetical protein
MSAAAPLLSAIAGEKRLCTSDFLPLVYGGLRRPQERAIGMKHYRNTTRMGRYPAHAPRTVVAFFRRATWMGMLTCLFCVDAWSQPAAAGAALSFDGAGGFVSVGTTGSLTGTFTLELWANPTQNTSTDLLACVGSRTPFEYGFDLKFWKGNLIHADIGNGATWITTTADADFVYTPGVWTHIALVVTPTNYTIYVDGLPSASGDYPSDNPILYDETHQLWIGHIGYSTESMNGLIDEVRIWSTARSASEIQTNANRSLTGAEEGLMGYWRFDEGSGSTAADASGHGFTGTWGPRWVTSTAPIVGNPSDAPSLHISLCGNATLIWWPTNAVNYVLETSASLGPNQNWHAVSGPVVIIDDQNVVAVTSTKAGFLRLRRP